MATTKKAKKNLIVSYKNLSDDLKEKFKLAYPEGYSNYITRFVKPNGDPIFVVPFETEDTAYMVKFDVKIDTLGQDLDKALFDDDDAEGKDEEFAPLSEAIEKEEENTSHNERHLRHGDFEDIFDDESAKDYAGKLLPFELVFFISLQDDHSRRHADDAAKENTVHVIPS